MTTYWHDVFVGFVYLFGITFIIVLVWAVIYRIIKTWKEK